MLLLLTLIRGQLEDFRCPGQLLSLTALGTDRNVTLALSNAVVLVVLSLN